jgi:Tfp pilus assembly protein FimT
VGWCVADNPTAATPTCVPGQTINSDVRGFVVWVDENDNLDANGARILTDATDGNGVIDAGELILSRTVQQGLPIRASTMCGHAEFAPTGFLRQVGGACFPAERAVLFCDDRGRAVANGALSSARVVLISRQGRAEVLNEKTAVDTWAATPIAAGATCP